MKKYIYLVCAIAGLFMACRKETIDTAALGRVIIDSISPGTGPSASHVIVYGKNFSYSTADIQATLQGTPLTVVESSPEQMLLYIPAGTQTGTLQFKFNRVHASFNFSGQVDSAATGPQFVIREDAVPMPIFRSFAAANGKAGDVIGITGYNFDGSAVVMFGEVAAELVEYSPLEIKIKLPKMQPGKVLPVIRQDAYTIATDSFLVDETPAGVREIYWSFENKIGKAVIDENGNAVSSTIYDGEDGLSFPQGVKAAGEYVFWGDGNQLMRGTTDGAVAPQVLFSGDVPVIDIDIADGMVYFALLGGDIKKISAEGSGTAETLYQLTPDKMAFGLKVYAASGKIFWTDLATSSVVEGTLDGQPEKVLFDAGDGLSAPVSIVVDEANGKLYIADMGVSVIFEGNADGSGTPAQMPISFPQATDLEWDPVNGFLYWMRSDENGSVMRIKPDGSAAQEIVGAIKYGNFLDLVR